MDRNQANLAIAALICATALLVAVFVWPTPYLYITVNRPVWRGIGGYSEYNQVWRINRLTGSAVAVEVAVTE
jgi:hypothetical protein